MRATEPLATVKGYLGANIRRGTQLPDEEPLPAITITRQMGSRALSIGKQLHERLQAKCLPAQSNWEIFENDLIGRVLEQSDLPVSLAKYYTERSTTFLDDTIEDIVGLHPTAYTINGKCHQTIVRLCQKGHVIVVGRCGNLLTRNFPNVLHVRLVGSISIRTRHIMKCMQMSLAQATKFVRKEDALRRKYAKENFNRSDVNNPLLYDLVINTDDMPDNAVIDLIEQALAAKTFAAAE